VAAAVRIVLVEDNDVYRNALELVLGLRDDVEVVASIAEGGEAAAACARLTPDVCLMDNRLPGADGVAATRAVRGASPGTAVVGLTAAADADEREAMLAAGAVACLSKDEPFDAVVDAILLAAGRGS
jgi:two-component system, NarL family, response regulator DesR